MVVVGAFQLVLDDYAIVGANLLGNDVGLEDANARFRRLKLKLDTDGGAKELQVLGGRKPRRKLSSLVFPKGAQIDSLKCA